MDIFEQNAIKLVERIRICLIAGRDDVAEKLALDALRGHVPVNDDQFTETLAAPSARDISDKIWRLADHIFAGQPAMWRSQVGELIKVCGRVRALGVVQDCSDAGTGDPKSYLGAAIKRRKQDPCWKLTDDELTAECESYGISTGGKDRKTLEAQLTSSRKRAGTTVCGGIGSDFIEGYPEADDYSR